MGRVCSIHEVWCPDGACKWCEAPEGLSDEGAGRVFPTFVRATVIEKRKGFTFKPAVSWLDGMPEGTEAALTFHGVPVIVDPNMSGREPPVLVSFQGLFKGMAPEKP